MKKLLFLVVIASMLFQPCFANIEQSISNTSIQSEYLTEIYDGYNVTLKNTSKNPVKIISFECPQATSNAKQAIVEKAMKITKKNNKYFYLSVLTFGITGFVGNAKNSTNLNKENAALVEADAYTTDFQTLKNEVILAGSTKTIKILVKKNEKPEVEAVFQDTKTNEYIKAK